MAPIMTPDIIGAKAFRPPRLLSVDIVIKVLSLVFAFIGVTILYRTAVYPAVEDFQQRTAAVARHDPNYVPERSIAVIVKDTEQFFELVFWTWAVVLLIQKIVRINQENKMLGYQYIRLGPGERILPDDALVHYKDMQAHLSTRPGWRERVLPSIILGALHRFHTTRSVIDAAQAIRERAEIAGSAFEADLSLIRFIAWAIPAIGFIGTVRGIGEALSQAQKAISGDITGVVESLGLAFNSTLVALVLSIPLMFLLHILQGRQDKLIVDLQDYGEERIVGQMKVPSLDGGTSSFQQA